MKKNVQAPDFQIFPIHDDVIETKQDGKPIFDHNVAHRYICSVAFTMKRAFWALEHDRNHAAKHGNCQEADLLIFADFAKFRDANSKISESTMADNGRKMVFVKLCHYLKCMVSNAF